MPTTSTIRAGAVQNKLVRAMKADPKKTCVLTLLVTVLAVLWVRMLPGSQSGATPAIANVQAPKSTVQGHGSSGASNSQIQAALVAWQAAEIPTGLGQNLFAAKLEYFPSDGKSDSAVRAVAPVADAEGFWDEIEKSMSDQAEEMRVQRVLMENLQSQLSALRLESTLMGARPKAVIDGELVGEGDVVASGSGDARTEFRVLKIEARRVIVEREGIKLEIPMK